MKTRCSLVALALALTVEVSSSLVGRADEPKGAMCIRKPGEHKLFEGKFFIKVVTKDDFVGYEISEPSGGSLSRAPVADNDVKKDSAWFVYPLSATEIWIYDGQNKLECLCFTDDATMIRHGTVKSDAVWVKFLKEIPQPVVKELPERIKKLAEPKK